MTLIMSYINLLKFPKFGIVSLFAVKSFQNTKYRCVGGGELVFLTVLIKWTHAQKNLLSCDAYHSMSY